MLPGGEPHHCFADWVLVAEEEQTSLGELVSVPVTVEDTVMEAVNLVKIKFADTQIVN